MNCIKHFYWIPNIKYILNNNLKANTYKIIDESKNRSLLP